jgi:hypothetical protein
MNFLTRFLKVFSFALLLSAIGALIFYWLVISGSKVQPGVSRDELSSTIRTAVGWWGGFIIFTSFLLAVTGMKKTITVPVQDREAFLQRAHAAITGLRYRPSQQSESLLVFKPKGVAILAEKITVELGQGDARITAPRALLGKIRARL